MNTATSSATASNASTGTPRVAVIGAGFGGLALAVRLQSAGFQTTLFEARDKPGGRAYVYEDQGFIFDAGPTVITDPDCLAELFALSGRKMEDYVELMAVDPFYRLFWEDGYHFDYHNNTEQTLAQIAAKNPKDADGYKRLLAYSRELMNEGYIKLGTVPFLNFSSMLRAAPALLRLKGYRSVYHMVSSFIEDPQLRQAFSFNSLLIGGNPFWSSSIYAMIHALEHTWGVSFPKGGTHAMVRALTKLFENLGGTVKLSAPVDEILTEGNQVVGLTTRGGERFTYDAIASNADVVSTYDKMLRHHKRGQRMGKALKRKKFSPSLFVTYFGAEGSWPNLKHHSILFGNRYEALLKDIFRGDHLPDDFSIYLHAPSISDSSLAPKGYSTFYALSPVPNLGHADIDWAVVGPQYQQRILDYLDQRYLPGLKERIVVTRTFTPQDFKDTLDAHLGSAFSLEPVLTQSAFFRTHNRDDVLSGLYFAGAGTHPGAGIPGVVGSAKATATLMLEDYQMAYSDADISAQFAKQPVT